MNKACDLDRNVTEFTVAHALSGAPSLDETERDKLALLSPIEYGQVRKAVAKQLGTPVNCLDTVIAERRKELMPTATVGNGRPLDMPAIVPAEALVNGAALLEMMLGFLSKHMVLPDHARLAIVLWIVRAHCDEAFGISPRLALLSPAKRCGKTSLLEIIAKLVPRPLPTANVTASVIFRAVEKYQPTLLIDEADSFLTENEELRGIINSGHRRDSAQVLRTVGDDHEPRQFSTWCPMVIAAIGKLPDTIEDRSIVVPMRRKAPGENVQSIRWSSRQGEAVKQHLHEIARAVARWSHDHIARLRTIDPTIPAGLHDRAADNWSPLLTIAEEIGSPWAEQARQAAVALSTGDTAMESRGIELLRDIATIFADTPLQKFPSQMLCDALEKLEERPWAHWRHGQPISPAQLAKLLKDFKIESRSVRAEDKVLRGYHPEDFHDAFSRYLAPNLLSGCNTATTSSQSGENHLLNVIHPSPCSTLENALNPALEAVCSTVALQNNENELEEVLTDDH